MNVPVLFVVAHEASVCGGALARDDVVVHEIGKRSPFNCRVHRDAARVLSNTDEPLPFR
jgi:hypothetical protein